MAKSIVTKIRQIHQFSNRSLHEYTGVSVDRIKAIIKGNVTSKASIAKLTKFYEMLKKSLIYENKKLKGAARKGYKIDEFKLNRLLRG